MSAEPCPRCCAGLRTKQVNNLLAKYCDHCGSLPFATCPRFGKWFQTCRFEPRYDSEPSNAVGFTKINRMGPGFLPALTKTTYVKDVCVRCGKEIHRNPTGAS